jgi:hypothetical protein
MRVGYVPHSMDLQHPADRRRLALWARERNSDLNITNPLDSDVLVLSNAANFSYWLKRAKQPVILDLVDAYIGEDPPFQQDFLRNMLRSFRGTSNFRWITYTRHLKRAIELSSCIIVASPEQRDILLPYNDSIYVVLDDHSELDSVVTSLKKSSKEPICNLHSKHLMWEGFGYTLKHFKEISESLDDYLLKENIGIFLVTNKYFPRWGGFLGKIETKDLMRKLFPKSHTLIHIIDWTIYSLANAAANSHLGIIPINRKDRFASLKSENKLLSMWHLGLLAIYSPTPAYVRVGKQVGLDLAFNSKGDWINLIEKHLMDSESKTQSLKLVKTYLTDFHSKDRLVSKWESILKSVLTH